MIKRLLSAAVCAMLLLGSLTGCKVVERENARLRSNTVQSESFGVYKHYFKSLSDDEKTAYNCVLEKIESFPEYIEVPMLSSESLERVWMALMYDNPQLIMLGRECRLTSVGGKATFRCDYAMTKEQYNSRTAELEDRVSELEKKLGDISAQFDKELFIHDTVIDGCEYVSSEDLIFSTPYGALVTGEASCEGYAKAAKLLLDAAGIENYLICGTAKRENGKSEGHMWNVVNIGGELYNLDLTWDDPISKNDIGNKRYAYFNITDEQIKKTHTFDGEPAGCVSEKENYFVKLGRDFERYDSDMRTVLSRIIAENAEDGKVDIRFKNAEEYGRAIDGLFEKEEIYRVLDRAAVSSDAKFSTDRIRYIKDDEHLILEMITVGKDERD